MKVASNSAMSFAAINQNKISNTKMLSKKSLKTDKRAWLKILEAFLGIMILIGVFAYITSRQAEEPDIDSEIHDILRSVFNSLRDDDMMRLAVLEGDECSVGYYIEKKIPSYLAFQPRICTTSVTCDYELQNAPTSRQYTIDKPQGNIYADYTIISSSIYQAGQQISPKILKLFVWEGTSSVPDSCPAEAKCGGDNPVVEPPEQCEPNADISTWEYKSCQEFGYASGNLKCTSDCFIDKSECEKEEEICIAPFNINVGGICALQCSNYYLFKNDCKDKSNVAINNCNYLQWDMTNNIFKISVLLNADYKLIILSPDLIYQKTTPAGYYEYTYTDESIEQGDISTTSNSCTFKIKRV